MAALHQPQHHGIPSWEDGWKKACEALPPDDKKRILSVQVPCCLDDVLKEARIKRDLAVSKRWKLIKSDGTAIILRDVFEKILSWISRYTQVADVLANADPVHAGLPWGACRFLLQVSMSDMQAFGSLSEGIELATGVAFRYRILEKICSSATTASRGDAWLSLSDCIIKVYRAVLSYLANAMKYWSHNTAARMARSLFKDIEAEQHKMRLVISKTDEEAFKTANIFQYQDLFNVSRQTQEALNDAVDQLRAPIIRIAQDVSEIQDRLLSDERVKVFRWLSSVPCESHHHESCRKILEGTGKWLLENAHFLDWQRSSSSAIFWLNGIPGSGKSTLTSIVIQALLERHQQAHSQRAPLAYFYCSQKGTDPRTAKTGEILRAVLRQLIGCDTQLALRGTAGQEFRQRNEKAKQRGAQILPLDISETVTQILAITEMNPIIIVLDALDEVDDSERVELFDALERIIQESPNVVKIFVSSRRDEDIRENFEHCAQIRIDDISTHDDIERFIEHKITVAITTKKLLRGKVSSALRKDILRALSEGARGMFRWVELSIEMLSNSKRLSVEKDIRSKLGQLPETLKQQYGMIYQDILASGTSTASIARKTFSWILAAKRALSVEEFIAAVALDDDGYYHTDLDVSRVLDICRNLIVVVSTDGKHSKRSFQVAHLSVKEYLMEMPDFSSERIHTTAMLRCLQTFDPRSLREERFVSGEEDTVDAMQNYATSLFEHAKLSELTRPSSPLAKIMKVFLFDERLKRTPVLQKWTNQALIQKYYTWRRFDVSSFPGSSRYSRYTSEDLYSKNGLYFISVYNLLSVLETMEGDCELLRKISSEDIKFPPLYVAVEYKNYAIAQWLLDRSILGVDEADKTLTCAISLRSAVRQGELTLVDLLLRHGADPLAHGDNGYRDTAWYGSCHCANFSIFRSLLLGIERNCEENPACYSRLSFNWKTRALCEVLAINWTEAIAILMEHDADVLSSYPRQEDSTDKSKFWSPLHVATTKSRYSMVKMLLEAASRSSREVSQHGKAKTPMADFATWINALDGLGRSALHCVKNRKGSSSDDEAVMKLLVAHGADPKVKSLDGTTAIHVAAGIGSLTMIRTFKQMGVDVGARANNGITALHAAAQRKPSTSSVVRFLIDEGLDPVAPDQEGRTPFHYAAISGNYTFLRDLCEAMTRNDRVVDLPGYGSASTRACAGTTNHCSFPLRVLFNTTDSKGDAPLHMAVSNSNLKARGFLTPSTPIQEVKNTILLLLEQGADINIRNKAGQTPFLHLIVAQRHHKADFGIYSRNNAVILELLLAKGADHNIPGLDGRTPLHHAASIHEILVDILLKAGADIEAKDHNLCTPLHLSSRTTDRLLLHGANPRAKDLNQATPLHYAAQSKFHYDNISSLVKANADVNALDKTGLTPLHWAAKTHNDGAVKALSRAGADPNIVDNRGGTPLHYAAHTYPGLRAYVLSLLVKANADVNALDRTLSTPLHWAAEMGNARAVQELLRAGADPEVVDNYGMTALHVAAIEASIIHEKEFKGHAFNRTWHLLYKASKHQSSRLKRSQSMVLRIDQTWGDFSHVRAEEIARR